MGALQLRKAPTPSTFYSAAGSAGAGVEAVAGGAVSAGGLAASVGEVSSPRVSRNTRAMSTPGR